jgi:hypothetical protein
MAPTKFLATDKARLRKTWSALMDGCNCVSSARGCLENVSDPNVAQAGKFLEHVLRGRGLNKLVVCGVSNLLNYGFVVYVADFKKLALL